MLLVSFIALMKTWLIKEMPAAQAWVSITRRPWTTSLSCELWTEILRRVLKITVR